MVVEQEKDRAEMKIRSKVKARPQLAHKLRKKELSRNACRKSKGRRVRDLRKGSG